MENFMVHDFNISRIVFAMYVPPVKDSPPLHVNRPSHGLVYNLDGVKNYILKDNKTVTVGKDELLYLPKYSTYKVDIPILGPCIAINFDLNTDDVFIDS